MSVLRFVLQRLAHGALITLGVSVLTFTMLELAPGEFFDDLKLDATVTAGTVDTLRQAHGLTAVAAGPLTRGGLARSCAATSASRSRIARRLRRCCGSARGTRSSSPFRRCSSRG